MIPTPSSGSAGLVGGLFDIEGLVHGEGPDLLLEGDVNWKAVMTALVKVGYNGFISPEIGYNASQTDQLKQVSAALDKILALA